MRSVTQGDVIRADAKDIPRIFQVRIALPATYTKRNLGTPWPLVSRGALNSREFLNLLKKGGEIKGSTGLFWAIAGDVDFVVYSDVLS